MSEPKRFNFSATIVHHIDGETTAAIKHHTEPDGLFVSYADYARLKAEVERLQKAIMDSVEMRQRLREIENGNQSK